MKTGKQISIGFFGYKKALNLIFKRGYAKYLLLPLAINMVLFFVGWGTIGELSNTGAEHFKMWIGMEDADFWGADFLSGALDGFIWLLVKLMFFVIFVYYGGFIIMIILSPIFSIISEKTERELAGEKDYPFNLKQFIKDIFRGIGIALRNLMIETLFLILVFILSFIPVIGWLAAIFMFFVSSYFYGFSYMDYTNERHTRPLKASVKYIRKYKWVAITNGAVFSLSLLIPYCGMMISPFVAVVAVIAGTVSMIEIERTEPEIKH